MLDFEEELISNEYLQSWSLVLRMSTTPKHIVSHRIQVVTKLHPRWLEVTYSNPFFKGHVNSPSQKGHLLAELPGPGEKKTLRLS